MVRSFMSVDVEVLQAVKVENFLNQIYEYVCFMSYFQIALLPHQIQSGKYWEETFVLDFTSDKLIYKIF